MPEEHPVTTARRPSYRHSSSICPKRRLLLLVFETLGGLHAALVDLRHCFGNLTRGELSAAAGGQATERVLLVELRRGRFGPARLELLDDRRQPLGLLGHRLRVALDEFWQHLFAHQLD